jgi:Tol biopolymer transport system component
MSVAPGTHFGPYEILAILGSGGMGDVYRARDTRLERTVAIKVVRGEFTERFEHEAKAISALNHPQICTLYDIGKEGDVRYLVMEYLEGGSLAERLHKGALPVEQAVRIASEMASALEAAHRKGIAHRDLKPGNVMLTKSGVKLLDFGLAKMPARADGSDHEATMSTMSMTSAITERITDRHTILGTPQYMAPEQIEGAETDHRADIFSFGCVLYEMISGKPPFDGKSVTSVVVAILERPAPPLPADLAQFDWLIQHCLEKDPEARFQSIHDVRLGLERMPVQTAAPQAQVQRANRVPWLVTGLALLAAAGVVAWNMKGPQTAPLPSLVRITNDAGVTTGPDISTDGKLLVYASDRDGQSNFDLYVQQIPGGTPVRITNTEDDETEPAFSPDGTSVAFHWSKGEGGIYIMPALGGEPRLLVRGGHMPRYSPDGATIAYWTGTLTSGDPFMAGAAKAFVIPSAGGTPRPIHPEFSVVRALMWSPDGQRLLFQGVAAGEGPLAARLDYWSAPVEGGSADRTGLVDQLTKLSGGEVHRWTREGVIAGAGPVQNFYRVPVDGAGKVSGRPIQLTNGTAGVRLAAVSQSGRLVFASGSERVNVWGVPIDALSGKVTGAPYRVTDDVARIFGFFLSADARNLVYASDRNGALQIWMKDLISGKQKVVVTGSGNITGPVFLRSGRIGFIRGGSAGKGPSGYIFDAATGESHELSPAGYLLGADSKEEFGTLRTVGGNLATVDVVELRTGRNVPLIRSANWNLYQARFSPDDRWITFLANTSPITGRIYVAPFRGMQQIPETEWLPITSESAKVDKPRFSPDGKLIYFTRDGEGSRSIQAIRFDGETGRPVGDPFLVFNFQGPRLSMVPVNLSPLDLAIGRDKLLTLVAESTSNIWMAEGNTAAPSRSK